MQLTKFIVRTKLLGIATIIFTNGLSGCGTAEKKVRYAVTCPGVRMGNVSYTDKAGLGTADLYALIPWSKEFTVIDGQKLSLSVQPLPLDNVPALAGRDTNVRYTVEIWVGTNKEDMKLSCTNTVQGLGHIASCSAVVGETTSP